MIIRSKKQILYIMSHPFSPTQGHHGPLDLMHRLFPPLLAQSQQHTNML